MRFKNREDAGEQLASALGIYRGQNVVVYALPRGGVVLGVRTARTLGAPIDLIVVRKIGHPHSPEYAIAAVADDGERAENEAEVVRIDQHWYHHEVKHQTSEALRRRQVYLENRDPIPVRDKTAIIVDDGLATGLTMIAALKSLRKKEPAQIIVAVPVAPVGLARELLDYADDVIVLHAPEGFVAVGAYYDEFAQVTDDEVIALLKASGRAVEG